MPEPSPAVPTPADARTWAARVPRRLLTVVAPILLSGAVLASLDVPAATVAQVSTAAWILSAVPQGMTFAAIPLLVARPHATIGWAALAATALVATPMAEGVRPVWAAVALVLVLLALADALGAVRQRVVARSWATTATVPAGGPHLRALVRRRRVVPSLVAVGGLAVGVVAAGWWVHDDLASRAFLEAAHAVDGTVVAVSDDELTTRVGLEDGTVVRVATAATTPNVGAPTAVLVAPGTDRVELAAEPFDASGSLFLASAGLLTAVVFLRDERRRRRAGGRLLDQGAPMATFVAVPTGGRWLDLEPVGAAGTTTTRVRVGWWIDPLDEEPDVGWDDDELEDEPFDDGGADRDDNEYAGWGAAQSDAVARMSDEELLALGAEQRADRELSDRARALAQAPLAGPTVVQVLGLLAQGDEPVLRTEDDRWLVVDRPARDRRLRAVDTALRLLGVGRSQSDPRDRRSPTDQLTLAPEATRRPPRLWRALVGATGRWLPWLLTPAIGALSWWLADVVPTRVRWELVPALVVGYTWATMAQDRLVLSAAGVRIRSAVFSALVRWSELERVVADADSVVLRVTDPTDALVVHQHRDLGRFLPGALGPQDVVRLVDAARPAPTALPHRSPGLVLTPGATVLLLWVAAAVVGAVLA